MNLTTSRRMDRIEIKASPQIRNALDELQRQREKKAQHEQERKHKAYRWRNFSYWCYQTHPDIEKRAYAARTSIPEEPLDPSLECNGGKVSCEECGGCQMPVWDEDIDIDKLSPEHRANWLEYLELFFSTPYEVTSEHYRQHFARMLKMPEATPWEELSAEFERRQALSPCNGCELDCDACPHFKQSDIDLS